MDEGRPDSVKDRTTALLDASHPVSPQVHLFGPDESPHVLVVDGDRVFGVDPETMRRLRAACATDEGAGSDAIDHELATLGLQARPFIDGEPPAEPQVRALSLAVAQKCNLGCTYCYAQQGDFGGDPKQMELTPALQAVELLLRDASPGDRLNLSFLGGEPLLNRAVLRRTTEVAAVAAADRGVSLGFSVTTNGTMLTEDDGDFFETYGFAVTVSIDGPREVHDQLRPTKSGGKSYDLLMGRVALLLKRQRRMQVSARVTVTPRNRSLHATLDELVRLGFHSVGFSPMLASPGGREEMAPADLEVMLDQMVDCGEEFERRLQRGERYPFSNVVNALREIHKGTHRPYPCGAGAGYMGVSANGALAACHRFVGNVEGAMGDLVSGVDRERQAVWLAGRHVDRQEPCKRCWARYLCGGGCHHEVIHRGRPACDYIRGWLHYCLEAYARVVTQRPDWFGSSA